VDCSTLDAREPLTAAWLAPSDPGWFYALSLVFATASSLPHQAIIGGLPPVEHLSFYGPVPEPPKTDPPKKEEQIVCQIHHGKGIALLL